MEDVGLFRNRGTHHHYACLRCLQPIETPDTIWPSRKQQTKDDGPIGPTFKPSSAGGNSTTNNASGGGDGSGKHVDNIDSTSTGTEPSVTDVNVNHDSTSNSANYSPPSPPLNAHATNTTQNNNTRRTARKTHRKKLSRLRMLNGCGHFLCELCLREGTEFAQKDKVTTTDRQLLSFFFFGTCSSNSKIKYY